MRTIMLMLAILSLTACMSDQQLRTARAAKPVKVCEYWAGSLVKKCDKMPDAGRAIDAVNKAMNVPDTQHTQAGY